ncbi:helix-turn-helix domain-containing protein [Solidesulfovibrio magneticus]|uniref:Xre family DNA-binding protein n=1 Tax=Solidesulfovibrio magneticus (strain ATCC 700980 / DSM 13731 / RS-1) TaxID=573370 RepID=C4XTG8_SOLM1|nr:helix-turn-helix transcriptional regulator [Solidesulfovibrio magneticus]BAH75965.1 Xre family DNA-binding protein [Solidesulfovibrio magneticus RS-1]
MNFDDKNDFAQRLRHLIQCLKIKDTEFAQQGGVTKQTLSGYLTGKREPGRSTLANWVNAFHVNGTWLLTGEGGMFSEDCNQKTNDFPQEEISDKLTCEQRNMLTYKRLQTELGMDKQRIAEGLEAIVMGKRPSSRKPAKEYGSGEDVGYSERGGDELFGG